MPALDGTATLLSSGTQGYGEQITGETIQLMKDATQTGMNTALGLYGYGLESVANLLYPLEAPVRLLIPRTKAQRGSLYARWKALFGWGYTKANPAIAFSAAGQQVTTNEANFALPYAKLALGDVVSQDAEILATDYDDLYAKSSLKTMLELMLGEDVHLIGGQTFNLAAPVAPTLTFSTTGGSITEGGAAVNWKLACAVRTGEGYTYLVPTAVYGSTFGSAPGPSASVAVPIGSATTCSIAATVASVPGAACYDWYWDNGAGGSLFYGATTTVNAYTVTAAANTANPALPTTNLSGDPNALNGLVSLAVGTYSDTGLATSGGRSSNAFISSLDGGLMTPNANGTISQIDAILLSMAQTYKTSPTKMLMNPQQALDMSNAVTGGTGTIYRLPLTGQAEQAVVLGGVMATKYLNRAFQGRVIDIIVDPQITDGTIIGITETVAYQGALSGPLFEVETQQEFARYDYAVNRGTSGAFTGPRKDYDIACAEVLKARFPAGMFVLQNIGHGA